jgi:hypothetical protein
MQRRSTAACKIARQLKKHGGVNGGVKYQRQIKRGESENRRNGGSSAQQQAAALKA